MKTIEKYTPLIKTPFVFHLEDDYEFFDYGFIELSFQIMKTDPKISQVLLQDEQYDFAIIDIGNELCYKIMSSYPNDPNASQYNNGDGALEIFSWRPSLKRIEIQKLRMPYELWDDEFTIGLQINKLGYYAVVSKDHRYKQPYNRKGFCMHIGVNDRVSEKFQNIKIIGRADFPDKINMRIRDI